MSPSLRLFLVITLPLAAFGAINQASRTVMAIIGPGLATELSLSASALGLLAACMFAAYAGAQLPVGIALDRWGPRRIQTVLALLTAAGFALFAQSHSLAGLAIARIIVGIGISAALMAIIKAHSLWCGPSQVANMTGIAMVVGALGSVLTTAPAQAAMPLLGWRGIFWLLCACALANAAWVWFSVGDKPAPAARYRAAGEAAVVWQILSSGRFWRFAPAASMLSVLNFTYLGLWAGPWLRDVAGYDGPRLAQTLFIYTLALMAGGYVVGWAASRAQTRGMSARLVPGLCTLGLLAAQAGLACGPSTPAVVTGLWLLFGFCASGGPAGYIVITQMFPLEQTSRVSTAINSLTLGSAFLLQTAIGAILDLWPRTPSGGWDSAGYSAVLLLSIVLQLFAAALASFGTIPLRRA
ncbi:MAG: MFS transporter [Burkholderiales bacterium]|nr:MFS transporter [Burkholderiales bacterium]